MGYVLKGSMTCVLADGTKMELKEGESYSIPAGHDAWTEEGCEVVEFAGAWKYVGPAPAPIRHRTAPGPPPPRPGPRPQTKLPEETPEERGQGGRVG